MAVDTKTDTSEAVLSYLRQPYARLVLPEADGTFRGEILEFPGCIATGETAAAVLASLESVAASWLEAALANGQKIPEPIEGNEHSGKLVLRLPRSLHKRAARMAERDGVSLNQFIVTSVAQYVGETGILRTPNVTVNAVTTVNLRSLQNYISIGGSQHAFRPLDLVPLLLQSKGG